MFYECKKRCALLACNTSKEPNKIVDILVYTQALHKLVLNEYLVPSTVLSHHSPHDKLLQYEKEEKSKIKNFPTAKELLHAKESAEARLKRELEEAMKTGLTVCSYFLLATNAN